MNRMKQPIEEEKHLKEKYSNGRESVRFDGMCVCGKRLTSNSQLNGVIYQFRSNTNDPSHRNRDDIKVILR